jgi:hypothetical protein
MAVSNDQNRLHIREFRALCGVQNRNDRFVAGRRIPHSAQQFVQKMPECLQICQIPIA